MRVLVTGARGFIGSTLVDALMARGHHVVACMHGQGPSRPSGRWVPIPVDFEQDTDPDIWIPRLAGVDAAINTVGILRECPGSSFDRLHYRAPAALFGACEQAGVRRCIQVSALGADAMATSAYHRSKHAADEALRGSKLAWTVVQPSLVFGQQGASTRLFTLLATLPVTPLVGSGNQAVQPIHIRDLVELLVRLVERKAAIHTTVAAVGPRAITLRSWLAELRRGMGLPKTLQLPLPVALIWLGAWFGDTTWRGALSRETLGMLQRGNTARANDTEALLGRPPLDPSRFIPTEQAAAVRVSALSSWLKPLGLVAIAVMWLSAGIFSWAYAQDPGLRLLAEFGLPSPLIKPTFAAACTLDIALGLLTLIRPGRLLWTVQLAAIVFYSIALSIVAPQLWLDPFGPLTKNLPIGVALLGLAAGERAS